MKPILARNVVELAKAHARPSGQADYVHIATLARSYRHGRIQADDIPPAQREAVMVYLQDHPTRKGAR